MKVSSFASSLRKHGRRIALLLVPLLFALLHAGAGLRVDMLERLDNAIYDLRLRATMPGTLDPRIVIVDIDEKSLSELGHWPWGRDQLAALTDELFERQQVALLGFDVFFAEPDESSGLKHLQLLAHNEFQGQAAFQDMLARLQPDLDYDSRFARSLKDRPVVLSYYFNRDRDGRTSGVLPAPVMELRSDAGFTRFSGYGSNIEPLARAAPMAGHANPVLDSDGIVRAIPLIAAYRNGGYEALSLALYRVASGLPKVAPGLAQGEVSPLGSIALTLGNKTRTIPLDQHGSSLIPFRGAGGVGAGSFRYVSATDLLHRRVAPNSLKGQIVLVGSTAPGLLDLRATPVGSAYPGVEMHASLLSGLLDDRVLVKPDYAQGFELAQLLASGLLMIIALPLLSAMRAVALGALVAAALVGINLWAYLGLGLALPLASALVMAVAVFSLNMSYGYLVESRSKRELAHLFGTYVPPELVDEMLKDPDAYSMQAVSRELTVMFCDLRGFTRMSESMEPTRLQALLNTLFSRLTRCIRVHRGTIDKYMGDCVMAFWGAPVAAKDHATLAVGAALDMVQAVRTLKLDEPANGVPGMGIGLNTGLMCVGDMGSDIRRSYTVVGDAVNLGARLEGLSTLYGVDIIASESTREQAADFAWQELDRVRVKGKSQTVRIFTPLCRTEELSPQQASELERWALALQAYRMQDWDGCELHLTQLQRENANTCLYPLYASRVSLRRSAPFDPEWDGATQFDNK